MWTDLSRRLKLTAFGLAALLALPAAARAQSQRSITVMTQNVYQGSELHEAISAQTIQEFVLAVSTDYGDMLTTNLYERAASMAAEIARTRSLLVGLQEVALWRTGESADPPVPATNVSFDFLKILIDALAARGLSYAPVVTADNWDVQGTGVFPSGAGFTYMDVRLTERTAIIARTDAAADELRVSNPRSGYYTNASSFPIFGGGTFTERQSWLSVDATVRGKTLRFITTHLDPSSNDVCTAQVGELLAGPARTNLPVVITGDLNSPSTDACSALRRAGFVDAWHVSHPSEDGPTCCQSTDLFNDLTNPTSSLTDRIDYVLVRGALDVLGAQIVGADQTNRTASGLWPSDHAGLSATVGIEPLASPKSQK